MKIYFCDLCNESIPLQDIKDNLAATIKGKIYCKNHNPLKDVQAAVSRQPTSLLTAFLLIVLIVLVSVLIGLMVMNQDSTEVEYATADALNKASATLDELKGNLAGLDTKLGEFDKSLIAQSETGRKMDSDLRLLKGDLLGVKSELSNISKNFQSVTNIRQRIDSMTLKQSEYNSSIKDLKSGLDAVNKQLADLENRIQNVASQRANRVNVNTPAVKAKNAVVQEDPELQSILEKLKSSDEGDRFEAVYKVLDKRLKEALPEVKPLIHDKDQFVQLGAIQTVGEFLYLDALPDLVKVLRDPDVTVRDESLRQLIKMTGQNNLHFDVRGSQNEKEKAVKAWEKWLKNRG